MLLELQGALSRAGRRRTVCRSFTCVHRTCAAPLGVGLTEDAACCADGIGLGTAVVGDVRDVVGAAVGTGKTFTTRIFWLP